MSVRSLRFLVAAVPAIALCAFAHAGGRADPDYPQTSQSTMSRDAVEGVAVRANHSMHATEVMESQPAPMMTGNSRAQVQAEATRWNHAMHSTEVPESQPAPQMQSSIGFTPSGGAYGG